MVVVLRARQTVDEWPADDARRRTEEVDLARVGARRTVVTKDEHRRILAPISQQERKPPSADEPICRSTRTPL